MFLGLKPFTVYSYSVKAVDRFVGGLETVSKEISFSTKPPLPENGRSQPLGEVKVRLIWELDPENDHIKDNLWFTVRSVLTSEGDLSNCSRLDLFCN